MVYAPMITAGYRVTLGVGRDRFVVHATPDRAVVCGKPRAPGGDARDAKLPPADAVVGLRLAEQARADLASRLRVGKDERDRELLQSRSCGPIRAWDAR